MSFMNTRDNKMPGIATMTDTHAAGAPLTIFPYVEVNHTIKEITNVNIL